MLGDSRLERVDTIEIEPAMIEAAKAFGKYVERAYNDPRSHFHIEDARTYFSANRSKYDIILSEPSNPWVSGIASLFSEEFYDFVPHHLAPGGLLVQWIQLYEINDELVGSVVHALSKNFADYRVYLSYNSDMLIVARADGPVGDLNPEPLLSPTLRPGLSRLNIDTVPDILSHQIGDRRSFNSLFAALSRRTNSDYYPHLSLEAPIARFTSDAATTLTQLSSADLPYREVLVGLAPPSSKEIVKDNTSFSYSDAVHFVSDVATMLRKGGALEAAGNNAEAIAYLRYAVGECQVGKDTEQAMENLVLVAGRTLPLLPLEERKGVWIDPEWIHCNTQPPVVRLLLDTIAALAVRDGATVKQKASELLANKAEVRSVIVRDWLLRAAMLGAVDAKDYPGVLKLQELYGSDPDVKRNVPYRYWTINRSQELQGMQPAKPHSETE
jgi:hypothetical protein